MHHPSAAVAGSGDLGTTNIIGAMKLADDGVYRAVNYIAAISRQGYTLNVGEVRAYSRRASRRGRSIYDAIRASQEALRGKVREEAVVWLNRVGWIDLRGSSEYIEDEDEVILTPLGKAAVRALDEAAASAEESAVSTIALDKGDPTALAKVVGRVAELGPAALVDRYFREEAFLPVRRTDVTRVLMGPDDTARVAAIEQALAGFADDDRPFEVRVDEDDEYHDRYVIPDEGPILALGTSVGGVGARHSTMTEIKDESVVRGMRENFNRVWSGARILSPEPPPRPESRQKKVPEDESADGTGKGEEELLDEVEES